MNSAQVIGRSSSSASNDVPPIPLSIYFGGCSFGCIFYAGVHKRFIELWGEDYYKKTVISGGSAGSVIALAIALGKSPEYFVENLYVPVAEAAVTKGAFYHASVASERVLIEMVNEDPLSYKKIEGRFCIGTTAFFSKHKWHLSWENNDDLLNTLFCSYHVPFYAKSAQLIHGELLIDGAYGIAGVDFIHDDDTLFVGIDPHAEISRSLSFNQMFFPLVGQEMVDIMQSGYDAAVLWDGFLLKKVGYRQPNYSVLVFLWVMMYLEYFLKIIFDYLCKLRFICSFSLR